MMFGAKTKKSKDRTTGTKNAKTQKVRSPRTWSSRIGLSKSGSSKAGSSKAGAAGDRSSKTATSRGRSRSSKTGSAKTMTSGLNFWGVSARVVLIVFSSLLVLSCASVLFNPAKLWLMNLLGLMFLPLFLINLVLFFWAVRKRSWASVIPLVAIIPACFFFTRYVQPFHWTVDAPDEAYEAATADNHIDGYVYGNPQSGASYEANGGMSVIAGGGTQSGVNGGGCRREIRIVSYNVGRFALSGSFKNVGECSDSLFAYLSTTDSDIICLQEFYGLDANAIGRYIHKYLPGYQIDSHLFGMKRGCFGNVTLSRIPVVDKGKILFPESRNLAIYTEYESGGDHFRVYNCHLESYAISLANCWKILKGDKQVFMETGQRMRRSILRRPQQVDKVLSSIENCRLKSFVCGDFNDSPISNTYYRVSRGRVDSFVNAGHGFGATFGPFWPFIRIDYIFCPEEYVPLSHYTPKMKYSDHYPIISDIELVK